MKGPLGIDYSTAVIIGTVIIVGYTFLGGFIAVSWTDLFQGTLMFFALLIVPVAIIIHMGGFGETAEIVRTASPQHVGLFGEEVGTASIVAFVAGASGLGIGLFWAASYFDSFYGDSQC